MIHRFVDLLEDVVLSPPFSVLDEPDGDYHVLIVRDGTVDIVTPFPIDGKFDSDEIVYPVLSPDRSKIIYRMPRLSDGAETLYGINSSGGTPVEIVVVSGHRMMHPMWHPDSDQIVYSRGHNGAFGGGGIFVTDYGGATPDEVYTPSPIGGASGYYVYRPMFNYDGSKIAFWLMRNLGTDANEGLYVMDADGSNVTQIRARTGPYRFAGAQYSWANTQNKIAYEYGDDVFVINSDGTGETTISVGETATQNCRISKYAWAADDALVYFASKNSSFYRPYSAQPGGGGVVRLNSDHGPWEHAYTVGSLFRWFVDNRLYFIETFLGTSAYGLLASVAIDGSDYREDWRGSGDYLKFYTGTAIEFV